MKVTIRIYLPVLLIISALTREPLYSQQFTEVAVELAVADTGIYSVGGAFWFDYDGDGWLDLYVINRSFFLSPFRSRPNRLYRNLGNGAGFIDVAGDLGAQVFEGQSWVGAWADFDQDGYIEIFVHNGDAVLGNAMLENVLLSYDGTEFTDIAPSLNLDGITSMISLNIVDFDNDGDQDIFLTGIFDFRNHLFRNDGDLFTEVAIQVGIDDSVNSPHRSKDRRGSAWGDFDDDGDLDLYICRAIIPNLLFRNDLETTGGFTEIAEEMGVANIETADSSPSWVDYDNDGDLDLLIVSNIGGSVIPNKRLYSNELNNGGSFTDVSEEIGIVDSTRAWSLSWADFDNDGDLDLYITSKSSRDLFYRNDILTDGIFSEVSIELGISTLKSDNYHPTWGDYDNDGDLDLYVTNYRWIFEYDLNFLYRNNQNDGNYLFIRVLSANGSYSRHGSRVWIYRAGTDSLVAMREVDGHSGMNVQNQYDLHFGLNPDAAYDIAVRFTTRVNGENIFIDKSISPELGGVVPAEIGNFIEIRDTVDVIVSVEDELEEVLPKAVTLYQNYPNPFNAETSIEFRLPETGMTKLIIYDIRGREIARLIDREMDAGYHSITWNGSNVSSGIYFYRLQAGEFVQTKKMLLLK